jgi:hypothetical protein
MAETPAKPADAPAEDAAPARPLDDVRPDTLGPVLAPGSLGLPNIEGTQFRSAERDAPPAPAPAGPDIEQPACFYLGREFDLSSRTLAPQLVMYDARDLTTHGVVVGMTGSGKTGLCISLLEEAAIDGVPGILIDPKGDLTNLLLQFPELKPEDFLKWLNPEDARQKGVTLEEHARQLAERWRKGLAEWGQTPERIGRLKDSAEWRVYTPGSEAGLPLSVLKTFTPPPAGVPREALNQKIEATATALLGLTGTAADPVQSREHIFISQLLLHAWTAGKGLDLPELIRQIQAPPVEQIGAFDVETFYPEKDRLKLALSLNNLLAAPSFSTWVTGEPLDLAAMLQGGTKPRQLIFYVAHLEEAQRQFFITLLLEEVLSWTRRQTGTTGLRAILYFDEVFGYLPPHPANPPTKLPLMTLLKQARAFGVGVLLATQNPVDLDYKALSNAGTWFVGKLQTERDKARLLEGLEGVAAEQGSLSNRSYLETVISALGNRTFLLHDVHRGKPVLFQSRQALSFLRGPLTRDQIATLMAPLKERHEAPAAAGQAVAALPVCPKCKAELPAGRQVRPRCSPAPAASPARQEDRAFKQALQAAAAPAAPAPAADRAAPELPAEVPQVYLPLANPVRPTGAKLVYQPRVFGAAEVVFSDRKREVTYRQAYRLLAEPPTGPAVTWQTAERVGDRLAAGPEPEAHWATVPDGLTSARKLKTLEKALADFLYTDARLRLFENEKLGLVSRPGEDVLEFQRRCREAARQEAERAVAAEKLKYRPRFEALGAAMPEGPAAPSSGGLLKLVNPLWWLGLAGKQEPPGRGQDKVARLEGEWLAKQSALYERWQQVGEEHEDVPLRPRRDDVQITSLALAWVPFWRVESAPGLAEVIAAYR